MIEKLRLAEAAYGDWINERHRRGETFWTFLDASAHQPPAAEEEFEEDAEKRQQWFIFQRTFPFDELPADARREAWEARPADAPSGDSFAAVSQWQQIGPKPTSSFFPGSWGVTSGRINSIAVAPDNSQIVLIGGATGGIWRSVNGGTTFLPVSDDHVDLAVGSIAFAPSNSSIVYAGMGDAPGTYFGTGVLKSTDGGQTWTRVSNTSLPSVGLITKVEVDPNNPQRVYVAQYANRQGSSLFSSGFYYSTDGGVSWTRSLAGLARDLVRHPTQPNTYYLAMQRADDGSVTGGVFKSTNAGQSWSRVYTSPFATTSNIKIAVTPGAPQNLYVLVGSGATVRLETSINEGASWTNRGSNFDTGQFGYNCYLFVHPTAPNTIFVGTRDLWRSTDGGVNYTNITGNFTLSGGYTPNSARSHPDQHHFYISPANPNLIYIANDGGLWRSTDNAATFSSLNGSLALTMFVSYEMHPTDATRSYGGTQDNGTQKRNGGVSWREFATGDGGQTFVDPLDPSIVYATYVYNTIFRYSGNGDGGGSTIANDNTFFNDPVAFYPPFVGNDVNSNLYFGTNRLFISTNRGASWTAPGGSTILTFGATATLSAIGVASSNVNVIYTGASDGRVMVSTNGGSTWTDRTTGIPQRFVKDIVVSPTDPNTAFLTVSGFGSGHVFKTVNGGASWTNLSGNLPDIPVNTLLIDPRAGNSNTLYVGTDIGVFRSTVGGGTWETFNNGLPPTIISELDAQPGGLMQAGTYGRGAYEINLNDSACAYSLDPASRSFSAAGGSGSVNVITDSGCPWTTTLNAPASPKSDSSAGQPSDSSLTGDSIALAGVPVNAPSVPTATFSNPNQITINDRVNNNSPGTASLYPSNIAVSGMTGNVTQVTVTLNGVNHTYPDDIDVLLVGPGGQRAILMSDAGSGDDVSAINLTFDQTAAVLPDGQIGSGTYRPTNYASDSTLEPGGADNFPAPAPGQSVYNADLSVFNGTAANGTWQLFIVDDEAQDSGSIAGGWTLNVTTGGSGTTSWLNITSNATGSGSGTIGYTVAANTGTSARTGTITVNGQVHTVTQSGANTPVTNRKQFDFDGDNRADVSVFRPSNGAWYLQQSTSGFTGVQFGIATDKIVPADYDGDGRTDVAVFRDGIWYLNRSSQGFTGVSFGISTDIPVPADYDGDGIADVAVFRPSNGVWYLNRSRDGFTGVQFGQSGDKPVAADYDGDGRTDVAVNRSGIWYLLRTQAGFTGVQFGDSNDKSVPADYDGDGKADIAVFRPSNGTWYLLQSQAGFTGIGFGLGTDLPAPTDYDGDGKADVAVFRNGIWYLNRSQQGFTGISFGVSNDLPVPNAFVR